MFTSLEFFVIRKIKYSLLVCGKQISFSTLTNNFIAQFSLFLPGDNLHEAEQSLS